MIVRLALFPALLAFGALSLAEGCAPAGTGAPAAGIPVSRTAGEPVPSATTLTWQTRTADGTRAAVAVAGADPSALPALRMPAMTRDRWTSFLSVRVMSENKPGSADYPPVLGSYRLEGDIIRFEPRFPLEPGVRYRAEFDPVRLHALAQTLSPRSGLEETKHSSTTRLVAEFSPPKKAAQSTTEVAEVYPTSTTLPENLLRFYLHFSAPMSRGEAYRRIRLLDARGIPVDSPFLELDEELWSHDGKRFTLLFDPGRIKRGLRPREEAGPILEAGKSYSLVIDRDWPDAMGNPLKAEFRRSFKVGLPDGTSPDPEAWKVDSPRANTQDPLLVRFPEPLDRALLDRLIAVQSSAGEDVPGRITVAGGETIWRFTPTHPWRAGDYLLVIGTDLEDLAGNSVARPFEVDLAGPISQRVATEKMTLPFRIGPALP
ncbi:MAG: Ig-like domain-containing protein [Isosphaerales bacterium]